MTCDSYVRLCSIGHYKNREKDAGKIARSDLFLPAAVQHGQRQLCCVTEEPGKLNCIGIELLRDQAELWDWLHAYDWYAAGRVSSNRNILHGVKTVRIAVIAGGYVD